MKVVTKYECEACHTLWKSSGEARSCEDTHLTHEGAKVLSVHYAPRPGLFNLTRKHGGMPHAVHVMFSDGTEGTYVYRAPQGV